MGLVKLGKEEEKVGICKSATKSQWILLADRRGSLGPSAERGGFLWTWGIVLPGGLGLGLLWLVSLRLAARTGSFETTLVGLEEVGRTGSLDVVDADWGRGLGPGLGGGESSIISMTSLAPPPVPPVVAGVDADTEADAGLLEPDPIV